MTDLGTSALKCWAAACGGCGGGPSREHLVSDCLFPERTIRVYGFDWCKGEERRIGVANLVRKVLCKQHNSMLAETDAEAKKAVGTFDCLTPSAQAGSDPHAADNQVDGHKLERWLLKTAINVSIGAQLHIGVGMNGSVHGRPAPYLIDVAFGRVPFSHRMGAYFAVSTEESPHNPGELVIFPLVRDDLIAGFYFDLRSQVIFLNLFPDHAPATIGSVASGLDLPKALLDARLVWRPPGTVALVKGAATGAVRLRW